MPGIKGNGKILLVRFAEYCDELFQCNAGLQLGVVREITGDDLFLMKVTHLDRNIRKELSHPRPAVENDRLQGVSHVLQCRSSLPVCIDGFILDFLDIEVLL